MDMGVKIKSRRLELNMTQEELAEKLNVSRSTVSNWEIGRNYNNKKPKNVEISMFLGLFFRL